MRTHPQEGIHRLLAKALLGTFLFLLAASFWALPCFTAGKVFAKARSGPFCQEHKMFKAPADLAELRLLPAEPSFRFVVAFAAVPFALAVLGAAARLMPPRINARAREGTLPFSTSDPPRLPAFAALRDA